MCQNCNHPNVHPMMMRPNGPMMRPNNPMMRPNVHPNFSIPQNVAQVKTPIAKK